MKRIARRYLRPISLGKKSKTFYVFDIETGRRRSDGSIEYFLSARPEHFIFGVIYGENYRRVIYSVKEFKQEFRKKRYKNKLVFAHNAEYDLSGIYGNIYYLDRSAIFNGKFITCTNGNIKFADSFNLLPTSVKKLGELLGYPKGKLGQNLISRDINKDIEYCTRDCAIVYKSLQKMFADLEPSFTIGSLSLKLFRAKYLPKTIFINELADDFFPAYYGGRTEAFKIGDCDAGVLDLNSAYPFIMDTYTFPDPEKLTRAVPSVANLYTILNGTVFEGMAECTVEIPKSHFGPLPYRWNERLIFPVGKITGAWVFPELREALKHGVKILHVSKIIYSPPIPSPFKGFVAELWGKRNATDDEFLRYLYKLYLNNLYGKLAQREREQFIYFKHESELRPFMEKNKIRNGEVMPTTDGGYFFRYETDKLFNHTIAPWAAYITAGVRILLNRGLHKFADTVLYCDTDSLFVEGLKKYESSSALGGWKLEHKRIVNIRTLKDYVYFNEVGEETRSLKGVKKDSQQLTPHADVFQTKRMIRTRESFRRTDNLPPGTFIEQFKFISGDYNKRQILRDGNTRPFEF